MEILISGASGLIGRQLAKKLEERGHLVKYLSRKKSDLPHHYFWDYPNRIIEEGALENTEVIVHLAGASIAKRWTPSYQQEIISSRKDSARFLYNQCKEKGIQPQAFISASGINYYGTFTSNNILVEEDGIQHSDFLSDVCNVWEQSAHQFTDIAQRVVCVRTSPVFSKNAEAFKKLRTVTAFNLASPLGNGSQWFNWIHLEDMVGIYFACIENAQLQGAVNVVADEVPMQKELMKNLALHMGKFYLPLPVPSFIIQLVLGKMSEMILKGTRASNQKIKDAGYQFIYPNLNQALKELI